MARVCLVRGPAQLFFLMAGLHQRARQGDDPHAGKDHLVLAGMNVSPERRTVTERLARVGWQWASITWASDLLDEAQIRAAKNPSLFACPVRERVGAALAVGELWVCMSGGLAEKVLMLAWPSARLVLCDDGLGAYIHTPPTMGQLLRKPRSLARRAVNLARRAAYRIPFLRNDDSHCWPNRRLDDVYLLLGNLPQPHHERGTRLHAIAPEEALAVVRRVQAELNLPAPDETAPRRVLVLGQYFHQFGNMSWEEELAIYTDVCRRTAQLGFPVLWKEHPKAPRPFFPHLAEAIAGIEPAGIEGHFSWPIEFFADRLGLEACICGTSTCLFTLQQIYGMQTYTYAADLVDRLRGADRDVARLAARHAMPFEQFLRAHGAEVKGVDPSRENNGADESGGSPDANKSIPMIEA